MNGLTRDEAIGFMLVACKQADLNLIDTQIIMKKMRAAFDTVTPEEAVKIGNEWYEQKWRGPKK
ncbi:hypothetical protein PH235_14380 [Trichococcus sp. K1Tr]|jgi:hypothetical protein|uniref:hypothetical protein n=1 Tax=Trichococcus sp. K1Tr TaxID=3020847 RepID=UPI00232DFC8A|nr:hypothetical protein [Trichococcus sp. K1Tr]MDB6354714.1 hypothetical protein [Trichococcus sp. K1Tr]